MPGGWRRYRHWPRFNGAGMFLSRKYLIDRRTRRKPALLQWGRDVSIPEISKGDGPSVDGRRLQWGRDVSIPEMHQTANPMGALSMLQWGRDVSIPEMGSLLAGFHRSAIASMGPGCFYPGNIAGKTIKHGLRIRFNGAGMFLSRKCCVLTDASP